MIEFNATANKDGFTITVMDEHGSHTMKGELIPSGYMQDFENEDEQVYFDEMDFSMYDRIEEIAWALQKLVREIRLGELR